MIHQSFQGLERRGYADPAFIFQMGSTLITDTSSQIILINGARADNVFWQVTCSATLGEYSSFEGTIMALTSIDLGTGATVDGRLLARNGAVTLLGNEIIVPVPEPAGTCILVGGGVGLVVGVRRVRRYLPESGVKTHRRPAFWPCIDRREARFYGLRITALLVK